MRLNLKEEIGDGVAGPDAAEGANQNADEGELGTIADDQEQNFPGFGSQGHANAEFIGAHGDGIMHDSEDTECSQAQS